MTFRREDRDLLYVNGVVRWTPRVGERVRFFLGHGRTEHVGVIERVEWPATRPCTLAVKAGGRYVALFAMAARPYHYEGELSKLEIVPPS